MQQIVYETIQPLKGNEVNAQDIISSHSDLPQHSQQQQQQQQYDYINYNNNNKIFNEETKSASNSNITPDALDEDSRSTTSLSYFSSPLSYYSRSNSPDN